jgi:hypothetical protein
VLPLSGATPIDETENLTCLSVDNEGEGTTELDKDATNDEKEAGHHATGQELGDDATRAPCVADREPLPPSLPLTLADTIFFTPITTPSRPMDVTCLSAPKRAIVRMCTPDVQFKLNTNKSKPGSVEGTTSIVFVPASDTIQFTLPLSHQQVALPDNICQQENGRRATLTPSPLLFFDTQPIAHQPSTGSRHNSPQTRSEFINGTAEDGTSSYPKVPSPTTVYEGSEQETHISECNESRYRNTDNNDENDEEQAGSALRARSESVITQTRRLPVTVHGSVERDRAPFSVREDQDVHRSRKRCVIDLVSDDEAECKRTGGRIINPCRTVQLEPRLPEHYRSDAMDDEEYEIRLSLLEIETKKLELRLQRKAGKRARIA